MKPFFKLLQNAILTIIVFGSLMTPFSQSKAFSGKVMKGQEIIALPNLWKFKTDPNNQGQEEHWEQKSNMDQDWGFMKVPDNWDLHNELANYKGKAWYRTSFNMPKFSNKNIVLDIGEVGMSYTVYLNGKSIGNFMSGNYPEQIDISKTVLNGKQNTLTILVDNTLFWGAYWSWGGIRRPIRILMNQPIIIQRQEINSEPNLNDGSANISNKIYISNTTNVDQKIWVFNKIISSASKPIIKDSIEINIPANTVKSVVFNTHLKKDLVLLWHFDHPELYESNISLIKNHDLLFQHKNRFGIRKIETKNNQFYLNGEPVRLAGYNWVADDRTTGSTLPDYKFKADIDMMKSAGANMARISHRPLPEDVMDYLDEKGILVLAEFNNWPPYMNNRSEEAKLFAKKLVDLNRNHPCVFGWSVGNENGNLMENPEVNEYVASMVKYIKSFDPTHLVTYVSNTADFQDNDAAQYCDIIMINKYGGYGKSVDQLKIRYPDKAVFMSEYGSHSDNLIYDTPDNTVFKSLMVDNIRSKLNLIGYSIWTFNDYRSTYQAPNPLTTTPLHQNRQWGIVDVFRNKKRAYKQMQIFYAPIKQLNLTVMTDSNSVAIAKIQIEPRMVLDIPAFTLNGYKLVWELRNKQNTNTAMGVIELPETKPGSSIQEYQVKFNKSANNAFFKLSLLSSTGYVVFDSICHLAAPPAPKQVQMIQGSKELRVLFGKSEFVNEYIVHYKVAGVEKTLKPTIDHYSDLTGLSIGKSYEVWVTAKNGFSESTPSDKQYFVPKSGYLTLPPVIWLSEPGDHAFFIGYSFHYSDYQYEVQFGTDTSNKQHWKKIRTNNFSLMQVPGLVNDKVYYYQLRKLTAFNATETQWSELKTIVPNTNHQYGKPQIIGWVQQGENLILSCLPSQNAIGYKIKYKVENTWYSVPLNQSEFYLANIALPKHLNVSDVIVETL